MVSEQIRGTPIRDIEMLDALWIVLLGMAMIFAVLGILLGMMILLNKLIKPGEEE